MTNEEKLAEIRDAITCLASAQDHAVREKSPRTAVVFGRMLREQEERLARLTAPRGKTVNARVPVVVASSGTVLTRYWSTLCGPGDSGETRPYHSDEHTVWIDVDLPLREVPVVEGTVAE